MKADASKLLDLKCKRIFLQVGAEVKDISEIQNNDTLFISEGEDFYRTTKADSSLQKYSLVVLGDGSVGKSSIILRYQRNLFYTNWDPTIEDAYRKTVDIDGITCSLEILDTAGQEQFNALRHQWIEGKDGYLFVYSMDNPESIKKILDYYDYYKSLGNNNPVIILGNKIDLVYLFINIGKR